MDMKKAATPMWQLDFGNLIVYNIFEKICRFLRKYVVLCGKIPGARPI